MSQLPRPLATKTCAVQAQASPDPPTVRPATTPATKGFSPTDDGDNKLAHVSKQGYDIQLR